MSLVGALALTSWLAMPLVGFVAPVEAKSCATLNIRLGTVSPGTGTTATTFRFTVTVSDKSGAAPASVRVRVNGTTSNLSGGGTNFKAGVAFSGTRKLPAGTWPYSFVVGLGGGTTCSFSGVVPASVVVTAPPKPTPKPTAQADCEADRQADTAGHAETDPQADPEAGQGHAQTDRQARIDRLAETH